MPKQSLIGESHCAASPAQVEARYALALALQNANARRVLSVFRDVLAQQPNDARAVLTNYGLALMQTGDAGALALYQRAYAAGDPAATLREDMGGAYLQQNDIDHAIEQFRADCTIV